MKSLIILIIPLALFSQKIEKKKILIIIAHENFRDEELCIPKSMFIDKGYEVVVASTDTTTAHGMRGARVKPDILITDATDSSYAAIVLVGGIGAQTLFADTLLHRLIKSFNERKKPVAAICLAPVILGKAGILTGKEATVWSGAKDDLIKLGAHYRSQDVVIDENIVTGCGPNAAKNFAKKILKLVR